jgi:hypothetical protein
MKFNIVITSLIASYAAAISIPETAHVADLEARQDYIGELCTAPIVYSPLPPAIPVFVCSLSKTERKEEKRDEMK